MQWLFTNHRIAYRPRQHVIDSFFGFTEALGIDERVLRWDIPIPDHARAYAQTHLNHDKPVLVISPCSSMAYRNWTVDGYARVADHAVTHHGVQVVLTGGPSRIEREYGEAISGRMHHAPTNLIGQTDLKQLLAVLQQARAVIAPDSGPAHLASAVGTPVIGLYACTNPDRARPYLSGEYVINRYDEALQARYAKLPEQLPWGIRVKEPGTMERITVQDVTQALDRLLAQPLTRSDN
jgi:heptosyltransferase I